MIILLLVMIILLMIPGMRQIVGAFIWIMIILMWWNWPQHDAAKPDTPTTTMGSTMNPAAQRFIGETTRWERSAK